MPVLSDVDVVDVCDPMVDVVLADDAALVVGFEVLGAEANVGRVLVGFFVEFVIAFVVFSLADVCAVVANSMVAVVPNGASVVLLTKQFSNSIRKGLFNINQGYKQ